jgi:hypothetical protein
MRSSDTIASNIQKSDHPTIPDDQKIVLSTWHNTVFVCVFFIFPHRLVQPKYHDEFALGQV